MSILLGMITLLAGCDRFGGRFEIVHAGARTFLLNTSSGETKSIEGSSLVDVQTTEAATVDVRGSQTWPEQKLFGGKLTVRVATKFRDGQLLYIVTASPVKGPLFKAKQTSIDPQLLFAMLDGDGFAVTAPIPLRLVAEARQIQDDEGEPQSLQWSGSVPVSRASSHQSAAKTLDGEDFRQTLRSELRERSAPDTNEMNTQPRSSTAVVAGRQSE